MGYQRGTEAHIQCVRAIVDAEQAQQTLRSEHQARWLGLGAAILMYRPPAPTIQIQAPQTCTGYWAGRRWITTCY
jgi:hypothetical protein